MNAGDRQRVKAALDSRQRERIAQAHMRERQSEREARHFAETEWLPQAAEHVPPMTERELASLRSRRLR